MRKSYIILLTALFIIIDQEIWSQGLEDVIVETYYVADFNDSNDADGGSVNLPEGAVTYRIFLDLAEGYELQAIYGDSLNGQQLRIETSTYFWNNEDRGDVFGNDISEQYFNENTVSLDSYLTFGYVSDSFVGIPKSLDDDGSLIGGVNNDGGSEGVVGGLLTNYDQGMSYPLTERDGLIPGTSNSGVTGVYAEGEEPTVLDDESIGGSLVWNGSAITNLDFPTGLTDENIILIAQLTTDGDLSFELNIQLRHTGSGEVEKWVASSETDENHFSGLSYSGLTSNVTKNKSYSSNLEYWPNPVSTTCEIKLENSDNGEVQLFVFDLFGRQIYSTSFINSGNSKDFTLDLSNQEPGTYILNLNYANESIYKKIIKE